MTGGAASVTEPSLKDVKGNNTGIQSGSYQNSDLLRVDDRGTCLMCHAVGGPNPKNTPAPTATP
jgi:hypothetical protein